MDLVEDVIIDKESKERRLREKKKWFDMLDGENGANVCDSCPSVVSLDDRGSFDSREIEDYADFGIFLEQFFQRRDERYKKLFLASLGRGEDTFIKVASDMNLSVDRAEQIVDDLMPKVLEAWEKEEQMI